MRPGAGDNIVEDDITEQKYIEDEILRLNEDLKKRAAELEKAKTLAEAAKRTKSEFLANMSHELTTPLNSIIGFSQVLQDGIYGGLNEKQKEYVSYILKSGNRLLELINDMLELASIEAGKAGLSLSRFLLKDVIKSSMTVFHEESLRHNIKLSLEIRPDADIEIEADPSKISQVMFNLINNAMKFTPDGGWVAVSAGRNGDFVEVSVSDTGIGIKPEDMPRLFNEFTQLEPPYAKRYDGIGLGLILAKSLVEIHRGEIRAESEFGKGSRFIFRLPIKAEAK